MGGWAPPQSKKMFFLHCTQRAPSAPQGHPGHPQAPHRPQRASARPSRPSLAPEPAKHTHFHPDMPRTGCDAHTADMHVCGLGPATLASPTQQRTQHSGTQGLRKGTVWAAASPHGRSGAWLGGRAIASTHVTYCAHHFDLMVASLSEKQTARRRAHARHFGREPKHSA